MTSGHLCGGAKWTCPKGLASRRKHVHLAHCLYVHLARCLREQKMSFGTGHIRKKQVCRNGWGSAKTRRGEECMKFKGKAAVWFWGIFVVGNALFLWKLIFSSNNLPELIVGMAMFEVVFLPILLRNYIFLGLGSVTVVFGIGKDSIKISDIIEVYQTHNPIASSAASLDRIVIKGRRQEIMCAVQEKQHFFVELKKRNPQIKGI